MIFLVKTDLLPLIDLMTLDAIIDNNDTFLTGAESRAIQEMTSYLNVRYDVVKIFNNTLGKNELIVMYLSDILLYHLHSRIAPDNIPELRENRYKEAQGWLEKVADGFIAPILPIKAASTKLPLRHGSSSPKQKHYY